MKALLLFLLLPFYSIAQETKVIDDTLYTAAGFKIVVGDNVKLGTGTLNNGNFKYIGMSALVAGGNNNQNAVGKYWSGHLFKVKRIRTQGNKKRGFTYWLILGGGNIVNYECDIENAIASGEIIVPEEFRLKSKITVELKQPLSVADELAKLKKLLDDGVLTQAEYDAQKKKLLEQKN